MTYFALSVIIDYGEKTSDIHIINSKREATIKFIEYFNECKSKYRKIKCGCDSETGRTYYEFHNKLTYTNAVPDYNKDWYINTHIGAKRSASPQNLHPGTEWGDDTEKTYDSNTDNTTVKISMDDFISAQIRGDYYCKKCCDSVTYHNQNVSKMIYNIVKYNCSGPICISEPREVGYNMLELKKIELNFEATELTHISTEF
jgi:hypothetical protein